MIDPHPTRKATKKEAALEQWLQRKKKASASAKLTIPCRAPAANYPLTFGQEGIYYVEQYQPDTGAYNMPAVWRLHGPLDLTALRQSLQTIIQRHEALRTRFAIIDGQPKQIIQPTVEFKLRIVDFHTFPAEQQEDKVTRFAVQEAHYPFDLEQAPLLRGTVLHLAEDSYIFLLTLHHIVGDGWSLGKLTKELSTAYAALKAGQRPRLPDLPVQYADFAVWQREEQINKYDAQIAYWQQQLKDAPPLLNLPLDFPRPALQRHEGDQLAATLSADLTQMLLHHSHQAGATLFMILAAGFKLLLRRYTHRDDIIIGTPMVNRVHKELEPLIGYFLNALVLRTDLSGELTFQELLERVRQVTLDAYANQHLPYEKLVQTLPLEPHLSYNPLFQVFINMFTPTENSDLQLADMRVELFSEVQIDVRAKFDMTLYMRHVDNHLKLYLVYKTDLFRRERMAELLAQLTYLLEQIAANPQRPLADYSLVTPAAQHLLPDPTAPLAKPEQPLVTALIARWAATMPQHIALSQGGQRWTYTQLIEYATRIAVTLQSQGVEPEDVVAIYAPRSMPFIAGLIGTWLSGGVVVLVDPNLPQERKQLILKEAGVKHVIYIPDALPDDAWLTNQAETLNILSLEKERLDLAATNDAVAALPKITPDAPAYIFFTSGTTGTPKGILGSHQGLSHFLGWQGQTFNINPGDRAAQLTGASFDVILRDILTPLTRGATLCLPDQPDQLDFAALIDWLAQERITLLHTVPTLAQMWLQHAPSTATLPDVRWTFFAGEPLTDTLVKQWQSLCPAATLINLYGPTETTLAKCYYQVPTAPPAGIQPIGTPLPQTQVLILAPNGRLCGLSEVGEIVIRTPFRTRGYINAGPDDHRRFRPNHFRAEAPDTLYYTGDLGRYRPDGTVEILGRLDDQIKIRGVRIEPNEVAAVLTQHDEVKSCFVMAAQDEQQQTYLAAYIVPNSSSSPDSAALQHYLSQKLPAAMVPAALVMIESLPVTPNGKIDRRKLPPPHRIEPIQAPDLVAPRDPIEGMLAEVWQEVLGLTQLGIHDNFFQLGGHSLLAIQVISRLSQLYNLKIPLRLLFEHPTIAELALMIEEILLQEFEE